MKVAVVGCGAVGSFYGAKLSRSGHEVHFLLRSDYEAVQRAGVQVESPTGHFSIKPRCARAASEIGPADLVVVALKTTANHQLPALLPDLLGPETLLLTLQNGLGNEETLAKLFRADRVLGGLCFVCLNRTCPGVIRHLAHGDIVLGEFSGPPLTRTHRLSEAFLEAGIPCQVSQDLARARWEKLCWNIPFNGLGVSAAAGYEATLSGHWSPDMGIRRCAPTNELLADRRWEALVRTLIAETVGAARALGFPLPEGMAEVMIARTRSMGSYWASTLLDFEARRPLEVNSIFAEPLRRAKAAGFDAPRLSALAAVLTKLNAALEKGKI